MDLGAISFARNGQPLGQAFAHIRRLDYYPAASLSYGETLFYGIHRPASPAGKTQETHGHGIEGHCIWTTASQALVWDVKMSDSTKAEGKAAHAGERCEFNFGARPFAYPVAEYRAVQQPPGDAKAAAWLLSAFKRLLSSAVSCGWGLSRDTAWVHLLPITPA